MSGRHDLARTLPRMREGTALVAGVVDGLTDAELAAPSALPGWSRAHVVGHLARNAEGIARLATWARTGVETPMYASLDARAAEIERSAGAAPAVLRRELVDTAADLDAALDALGPDQWASTVRSALGRSIPATELPWMRIREVWLHAVDLDAGTGVEALPDDVVDVLLDDVTAALAGKPGCPSVTIAATDRDRSWSLGDRSPEVVTGSARELVAWLTGRAEPAGRPALPAWI